MVIVKEKTLREIKDIFSFIFPGIKIEFYKNSHQKNEPSPHSDQYDENLMLCDINSNINTDEIKFYPNSTVAEIEHEFETKFGLYVQLFRRSNELWFQTSTTDDWTLEVQNRKGLHSTQLKYI